MTYATAKAEHAKAAMHRTSIVAPIQEMPLSCRAFLGGIASLCYKCGTIKKELFKGAFQKAPAKLPTAATSASFSGDISGGIAIQLIWRYIATKRSTGGYSHRSISLMHRLPEEPP
jgi:hypothetical protein